MTTIDERLEEILREAVDKAYEIMDSKSFADPYSKPKAAIRTLFLDLIVEAKPESYPVCETYPDKIGAWCNKCWNCKRRNDDELWDGIEHGVDSYENNLKQAINGGKK